MRVWQRFGSIMLVTAAVACTAEITNDTYFCGPERLCPPGQMCDDNTFTCTSPVLAEGFSCPVEAESREPDDVAGQAHEIGGIECGRPLLGSTPGCITDVNDADYIKFEVDQECVGSNPRLKFELVFPVALVPLTLEIVDTDGRVVAEAEVCEGVSLGGSVALCIETLPPEGTYFVRIASDGASGLDCEGGCHFNQYSVSIAFPLN